MTQNKELKKEIECYRKANSDLVTQLWSIRNKENEKNVAFDVRA